MNDQLFLQNLTDFRQLKHPKSHESQVYSSNRSGSSQQSNLSPEFEVELQNNDKLLRNFKELREQLKQSTKNNQLFRNILTEKETEIERYKLQERDYIASNHQLKCQLDHLKTGTQDYKNKLEYLQEMTKDSSNQREELEYLKMLTYELKNKLENSQSQNKKILEISVIEKVQLEEQIRKLTAKKSSDLEYVQEVELQISKLREKNIKLENQLKRSEIKYDEELYNKKWLNGNFERQHLETQIQQLQNQNEQILAKHKKEKEKRNNLEKKVMELEQMTGLWVVKAETFEVENKNLHKKFKKSEKKMTQMKENASNYLQEALSWQQKFLKTVSITEELISRVKRDLYGDTVSLAKSCEYKIAKLKEEKQPFLKETKKSPSKSKMRSKSKPTFHNVNRQSDQTSPIRFNHRIKVDPSEVGSNSENKYQVRRPSYKTDYLETDHKKTLKNQEEDDTSRSSESNNQLRGLGRTQQPLSQIENIETRIRKQRQDMEKRIKEKMLYRKIEVTVSSPEKHRLREDYFRLIEK